MMIDGVSELRPMRRLVLLLILVAACKKKEEPADPDPVPTGPPPSGHSVTKINDNGEVGSGSGSAGGRFEQVAGHEGTGGPPGDGGPLDAERYGGNGQPP